MRLQPASVAMAGFVCLFYVQQAVFGLHCQAASSYLKWPSFASATAGRAPQSPETLKLNLKQC